MTFWHRRAILAGMASQRDDGRAVCDPTRECAAKGSPTPVNVAEEKWRPGLVTCDGCGLFVEFLSGGLGGALCAPCATAFTERNWPRKAQMASGATLEFAPSRPGESPYRGQEDPEC